MRFAVCTTILCLVACHKSEPHRQATVVCDAAGSDHDTLFRRGADLIGPHMILTDRKPIPLKPLEVRTGIACLDRVLEIDPDNWSALWVRGKAFQVLGDHRTAVESFRTAYRLNRERPEMGRELAAELLDTRQFQEALTVARDISDRQPQDAGLKANLALAQLLHGDVSEAEQTVTEALRLDPNDPITKSLARAIHDVATGVRPQPKSLTEFQRGT